MTTDTFICTLCDDATNNVTDWSIAFHPTTGKIAWVCPRCTVLLRTGRSSSSVCTDDEDTKEYAVVTK